MRKFYVIFAVLLLIAFAPLTAMARSAASTDTDFLGNNDWAVDSSGNILPQATDNNIGSASYPVKAVYTDNVIMTNGKTIPLSIMTFVVTDSGGSAIGPISTSTTPGLESDNSAPSLVWADGEVSYAQVTFRVPADYVTGGIFNLLADESGTSTKNQIDFNVFVNTDDATWDAAATNQTPVALSGTAGSAELVILTPSTDFSALTAGQWVTLNIWRDDTATGTNDLEVYYVEFYYE